MKPGPSRAVTFRTRYALRFDRAKASLRRCPDARVRAPGPSHKTPRDRSVTSRRARLRIALHHDEWAEVTGISSASSISPSGQCRIPFPYLRPEPSLHLRWPSGRDGFSRPRYRTRARKLTVEQESAIRALVSTKNLRSLAADFGVSHETIRAVVRQVRSASG